MSMILDGTNGATFNDGSLQAAAASPYVLKNRLINGAMEIDQRNAGASQSWAAGTDGYTLDRWSNYNSTSAGAFTVQQSSTVPSGFSTSMVITVTAADSSLGTTEWAGVEQVIEGYNISDFAWGTANAKTVTLSFWVRSSLTGTFGGSLQNNARDRAYPFTYTISSANTWEQKSITIAGDTSGTWLTTNGRGIRLTFGLGVGTTYSGTANSWAASTYYSATGATSVVGTNGATFYITGVQLEVGSTATPFERRLYGQELQLCQRYYWRIDDNGSYPSFGSGVMESTTRAIININHPVPMRASATYSYSGTIFANDSSDHTISSIVNTYWSPSSSMIRVAISGATQGRGAILYFNDAGTNYFEMSSEL